jgi:3-dehydroquinate synthase
MERLPILYNRKPCYDIVFSDSFDQLVEELQAIGADSRRICIVTDSKVDTYYGDIVKELLAQAGIQVYKFVFPEGEINKTLHTVTELCKFLIESGFDRKDSLLALGGGVVGDVTGYAAAIYLRGIRFIQVPTTLLSQADSSIGGKTGVDFEGYKNMIGAFHMPALVYMNLSTLSTLDERQY